ncbi:hypothetical protein LTR53_009962 [Teratosphaeriaceae sp. CCFEE 6253]|nr:hypothetical protein LTR53_009962 [Teratosphaeriaceae sp. CCFEE 6253]
MSHPREGVRFEAIRGIKRARAQMSRNRAEISRSAGDFADLLDADGLLDDPLPCSSSGTMLAPAVYARRVILRANQQANEASLQRINETLEAERVFIEQAQGELLQSFFQRMDIRSQTNRGRSTGQQESTGAAIADREYLVLSQGIQQDVRQKIDRLYHSTGRTALNFSSAASNAIPRYAERLLNDVFALSQIPNDAELEMLTDACCLPSVEVTKHWFILKRKEREKWAAARALLRKQKIQLDKQGRRLSTVEQS